MDDFRGKPKAKNESAQELFGDSYLDDLNSKLKVMQNRSTLKRRWAFMAQNSTV